MDQKDVKKQETKRKKTNTSIKSNNEKTATEHKKRGRPKKIISEENNNIEKQKNENKQIKKDQNKEKKDESKKVKNNSNDDLIKKEKTLKKETKNFDNRDNKKTNKIDGAKLEKKLEEELRIQEELKLQKEALKERKIIKDKKNNSKDIVNTNIEENITEIGKKIKEKRKVPKKDVAEMRRKYVPNLIMAVAVIVFFGLITLGFYKIQPHTFIIDLKAFGMLILLLSIILLENAYSKKDKIILAYGIECIIIATITISLIYIYLKISDKFAIITLSIVAIFTVYYFIKYLIIRRISKNNYFKDKMKEIIEKDEDVK